jgi:hypothetical protein
MGATMKSCRRSGERYPPANGRDAVMAERTGASKKGSHQDNETASAAHPYGMA